MADSDQPVPFRQRRYFYYLTGCTESDCSVLYDIAKDLLTLYIPKVDLRHAVWGGAGSTKSEAYAKYDVDAVQFTSEASKDVRRWAIQNQNNSAKLFFNPGTARDDNVVAVSQVDLYRDP
jgi:Xaa-Pro dipeptidase